MQDKRPYLFIYGENDDNKLIMYNRNEQMVSLLWVTRVKASHQLLQKR